jgi:transcriptional regulator of acetoin/glycerol metabolism
MARSRAEPVSFDGRCIERLCSHHWPYNVRELFQVARLLAASDKRAFVLEDLPERLVDPPVRQETAELSALALGRHPARRAAWLSRHSTELDELRRALHACQGNVSEAARKAGIPRHRARRLLAAASEE